jgi:H+/Cl- antiporter ClcA
MQTPNRLPTLSRFYRRLRPRLWADRALIWVGAIVTGLTVVAFVRLTDYANGWFAATRMQWPWLPLLITPAGGATVVWLTTRFADGAAGSGIPQVMAALNPDLPAAGRQYLVSLRLALYKIVFGVMAMFAGFSAGREGPSVQVAAGVLHSFHRWVIHTALIKEKDLILAGGAAGIAAAFNAPLAGVVFAIEELSKRFEERSSGVLITAIVIAGLVAVSLMGNLNYFGRVSTAIEWREILWPAVLVTLVCGVLGGLFSRLLIQSFRNRTWRFNQWRGRHPVLLAGGCGLVVAVLGVLSNGAAFGSGYAASQNLLANREEVSLYYFAVKFFATWMSFWSGIPGGIFAPSLAVGAGIGHDVAILTATAFAPPVIALGMAGFLAAVTQAPITSFIIVMEMTDGHSMVLTLMAAALLASMISRLVSEPLYPTLAKLQLTRVEARLARTGAAKSQ